MSSKTNILAHYWVLASWFAAVVLLLSIASILSSISYDWLCRAIFIVRPIDRSTATINSLPKFSFCALRTSGLEDLGIRTNLADF